MNVFEFDRDEQSIYTALSALEVDEERLKQNILKQKEHTDMKQVRSVRKPRGIAAAVALIAVVTVSAAFAVFGGFDWFMEKFNPDYQELVEPVGLSCEDQGIRMEVIAAQRYGGQAVVYLSLQDVSGQNRLTAETDFRDGFSVRMGDPAQSSSNGAMSSSFGWSTKVLEFDEETNTLYLEFVIRSDSADDSTEITLGSSLIYFNNEFYDMPLTLSLENIEQAEGQPYDDELSHVAGVGIPEEYPDQLLTAGYLEGLPYGNGEDMWISNIGILDGQLHVQIITDNFEEFGYGTPSIYLRSADGTELDLGYMRSFYVDENGTILDNETGWENEAYRYYEHVFPIDEEILRDATLWVRGYYFSGVEGAWRVATTLQGDEEQIYSWTGELMIDEYMVERIVLSPLGLEMSGYFNENHSSMDDWDVRVVTAEYDELVYITRGGSFSSLAADADKSIASSTGETTATSSTGGGAGGSFSQTAGGESNGYFGVFHQNWETDITPILTGDVKLIINGQEIPLTVGVQE